MRKRRREKVVCMSETVGYDVTGAPRTESRRKGRKSKKRARKMMLATCKTKADGACFRIDGRRSNGHEKGGESEGEVRRGMSCAL